MAGVRTATSVKGVEKHVLGNVRMGNVTTRAVVQTADSVLLGLYVIRKFVRRSSMDHLASPTVQVFTVWTEHVTGNPESVPRAV